MPFIEVDNCKLFYQKTGTAPSVLLLFHGFGQDHQAFDLLSNTLANNYTLYSFDLLFHGNTKWLLEEEPMEKMMWQQIISKFLSDNKIENFSMLGFSMGGKFALATLELFPHLVKEIFLLAPDGIKTNFWYSLATYPIAFRKVFKSLIGHHGRFLAIAKIAFQFKLIDRGVLRFVEYQMNTEEKRKRVYYTWVVLRHLRFDLDAVANLINKHRIETHLIIGKHDKIITSENMKSFVKKIPNVKFETIEAGHTDLIQRSLPYLTK